MDAPEKKKVVTKPRTKGRDRGGGEDTETEVFARLEIPKTKYTTLTMDASGKSHKETVHTICVPILVMGVRMSMLQMEEYLGICGIIPKRTDYPERDSELKHRIHNINWTKGGLDAKLYGDKAAFEGFSHAEVLHHIASVFTMKGKTNAKNRFGAVIDNKNYLYVGIIPEPYTYVRKSTDMQGFLEYTYREVIGLDIMDLERIQRVMYRIPIDDDRLDASQKKTLSDIRNGKLEKLPHFYIVERPTEVLRLRY